MTKTRRIIGLAICIATLPALTILYLIGSMKCALEMLTDAEDTCWREYADIEARNE